MLGFALLLILRLVLPGFWLLVDLLDLLCCRLDCSEFLECEKRVVLFVTVFDVEGIVIYFLSHGADLRDVISDDKADSVEEVEGALSQVAVCVA